VRVGVGERFARDVDRRLRRAVVDDALAERDRVRHLADEIADHGDDRRLDGIHARRESHGLHYIE
jgi:hypothetical protein